LRVELAKELGLDAKAVQFRTAEDIERAFSAFAGDRPDGLIVLTEQRSMLHAKLLAELSRRERLPAFFGADLTSQAWQPTMALWC
jgi:putative ABC transport system substrate-binding protein